MNVPIGVALILLAPQLIRADGERTEARSTIDWLGAALVTGGVALIVHAVSGAAEADPSWPRLALACAGGVALLVGFQIWEHQPRPDP